MFGYFQIKIAGLFSDSSSQQPSSRTKAESKPPATPNPLPALTATLPLASSGPTQTSSPSSSLTEVQKKFLTSESNNTDNTTQELGQETNDEEGVQTSPTSSPIFSSAISFTPGDKNFQGNPAYLTEPDFNNLMLDSKARPPISLRK